MAAMLKEFNIDVAMLPINGRKPERKVSGNLNGKEAAHLASGMGAKMVLPCHYDMFEFNTESPELFEKTCESLLQGYKTLQCGERFTWPA
jgi:L-ascorbate metabolism protein UlaG (beta-lactamase superfamily)